ncbi:hypothetical protein CIB84_003541 [Bambusicola thoracicus]|uniref:P-type ATPase N-terminal domain-containing protein n=1 Tax=Bambusicola thoracicus TaxID=9083 RepID=A0A2P4T8L1_BAMTH|nr:hypothetical protein CIB84_003541 [Bambusicola thoracicus]
MCAVTPVEDTSRIINLVGCNGRSHPLDPVSLAATDVYRRQRRWQQQQLKVANLYFLFLAVLNWVPLVEAFQKEITMLPLIAVLTITALKDGLEDYSKYKMDKQINNLITKVYSR